MCLTILPQDTALDGVGLLQNIFDFQHTAISFKFEQLKKNLSDFGSHSILRHILKN